MSSLLLLLGNIEQTTREKTLGSGFVVVPINTRDASDIYSRCFGATGKKKIRRCAVVKAEVRGRESVKDCGVVVRLNIERGR